MNTLEFIVALIGVLRWPVVVFVLLLVFHRPLVNLAASFRGGDVTAKFEALGNKLELSRVEHLEAQVIESETSSIGIPEVALTVSDSAIGIDSGVVTKVELPSINTLRKPRLIGSLALESATTRAPVMAVFAAVLELESFISDVVTLVGGIPYSSQDPDASKINLQLLLQKGVVDAQLVEMLSNALSFKDNVIEDAGSKSDFWLEHAPRLIKNYVSAVSLITYAVRRFLLAQGDAPSS
jgi:hypothetical protein